MPQFPPAPEVETSVNPKKHPSRQSSSRQGPQYGTARRQRPRTVKHSSKARSPLPAANQRQREKVSREKTTCSVCFYNSKMPQFRKLGSWGTSPRAGPPAFCKTGLASFFSLGLWKWPHATQPARNADGWWPSFQWQYFPVEGREVSPLAKRLHCILQFFCASIF